MFFQVNPGDFSGGTSGEVHYRVNMKYGAVQYCRMTAWILNIAAIRSSAAISWAA